MDAPRARAILIEEFPRTAKEFAAGLRDMGVESTVFEDGESAIADLEKNDANYVFISLDIAITGAEWFLQRLSEANHGRTPAVFLVGEADQVIADLGPLGASGQFIPPITNAALASVVGSSQSPTADVQVQRLRRLLELNLLGNDLFAAIDELLVETATVFEADDCVIWGPRHEPYWPRTARAMASTEHAEELLNRCEIALEAGISTFFSATAPDVRAVLVEGAGMSYLAAPLAPPGGAELGGIALVSDTSRQFSLVERDALRLFAKRLSLELAWVSAHIRLATEHEKLRETALIDPLLGVWTRSALEESIATEIAAARRRQEPLAVAVIDLVQLRQVNDRYGHLVGDSVLAHLAKLVRQNLRPQDLVGRFGGDELAILLVGADLATGEQVVSKIIDAVHGSTYSDGDRSVELAISVGLTAVTAYERSGEKAVARALAANRRARKTHVALVTSDPNVDGISGESESGQVGQEGLPYGSTLGGMYRILHEISRGAMGVVYRAEDLGLGRPVAIKVLRSDLAKNHGLVSRFRDEAAMLASLRHRNLVNVFSFGSEDEEVYFVMELVEGESLKGVLSDLKRKGERIDVETLGTVIHEMAEALDAIHSVGIIHRDVKPSNILLDRINDRAVLVDVGVAKRREDRGDAAGTPGYAAPESFMDTPESSATDVYGLAATAYKALTGRAPFGGGQVEQVVRRQLSEKPVPPSNRRPGLSPAVDTVLMRALHRDQEKRYQSAPGFAAALLQALSYNPNDQIPDEVPTRVVRHAAELPKGVSRAAKVDFSESTKATMVPLNQRARPSAPSTAVTLPKAIRGHTRGAVFRVASKLLGHRLGNNWVKRLAEDNIALAEVLEPSLSPMSWQPVDQLLALLDKTSGRVREPRELARTLGRATMSATFARFFGADPSTLTPSALLKAAEAYWSRYHTWGHVRVIDDGARAVIVTITECPQDPLIPALIGGCFERIAELSGAVDVSVHQTSVKVDRHPGYQFAISWGIHQAEPES